MSPEAWIYAGAVGLAGWAVWRYATQYNKFLEEGWNRGQESRRQIERLLESRIATSDPPQDNGAKSSKPVE